MKTCEAEAVEHEHCGRTVTVIVNGRPQEVDAKTLSYLEVIELAYPEEIPSETLCFTVTFAYRNGKGSSLVEGEEVKVKKEMVFNVARTDKS